MNYPMSIFMQGLISGGTLAGDRVNVEIVQDNCGKLSDRARDLVRLSYRSSLPQDRCSRWDTSERHESPKTKNESKDKWSCDPSKVFPILPFRRSSLGAGEDTWRPSSCSRRNQPADKTPNLPPRDLAERSSLRWALALEDKPIKPTARTSPICAQFAEDDDDTDSETDSSYSASELDFNDYETDSDSDDDEYDEDELDWSGYDDCDSRWASHNITPHEWTFPANSILPGSIQTLIREAAQQKDVDFNKLVQSSLSYNAAAARNPQACRC